MNVRKTKKNITSFSFREGEHIGKKYQVVQRLGKGWEGEVYLLRERETGIERAAKFFFPNRNVSNKTLKFYAKKLHKLRHCSVLIQYYTQELYDWDGVQIPFLVSEYVEGELLAAFVKRQPGKRLQPFQALHLLYALVKGLEEVHRQKEYHGDLHSENIIVVRHGLHFDLKLVDLFNWKDQTKPQNIQDDIVDMIKIFHEVLGGPRWYAKQPDLVKEICCGLRRSLILKKFRTSSRLRSFIENEEW